MKTKNDGRGILFILSAPSGAGKTTMAKHAVELIPGLRQSVSHTTRPQREGEVDGECYHFIDHETFEEMKKNNRFIEHAEVHENLYGTSYETLETMSESRDDLLLVIDIQGAAKLKEQEVDAVFIFVLPPSLEELARRLDVRGTENDGTLSMRLELAEKEIADASSYDYIIVNDDLHRANKELEWVVRAERLRVHRFAPQFPDYNLPPLK